MIETKMKSGNRWIPVSIEDTGPTLKLFFRYDIYLKDEIKAMQGARWNPEEKYWYVKNSPRNIFQILYLTGRNPYLPYDCELKEVNPRREINYRHQIKAFRHCVTRKQCILAAEPGTGKTLVAFETLEYFNSTNSLWVGPKGTLHAIRLELRKWDCLAPPINMWSYEQLTKAAKLGQLPDVDFVVFDEAHRLKNSATLRAQAAQEVADNIRRKYGKDGNIILMTGSPAPKSPLDWWSLAEIACTGFIKEGDLYKFHRRLAVIKDEESPTGGRYPKLVTWRDDENKCEICGVLQEDHDFTVMGDHQFRKGKNEIDFLYKRLSGLVLVQFKKDCLELPEKIYRVVKVRPSIKTLNAAKILLKRCPRAIQALTLTRELSDGFQYTNIESGTVKCENCHGSRVSKYVRYVGPEFTEDQLLEVGVTDPLQHPDFVNHPEWQEEVEEACRRCEGTGEVPFFKRDTQEVPCPKDKVLVDLLEENEEIGRLIVYAGYTASIDRVMRIVQKEGWHYIRVDGRGWHTTLPEKDPSKMLELFQDPSRQYEKIVFGGHPGSGGEGVTLTESQMIFYYSNDFNAQYRIQSEDRNHRPGCKGATIVDVVHLPTDQQVLDNLKRKRDLQAVSMGELGRAIDEYVPNNQEMSDTDA